MNQEPFQKSAVPTNNFPHLSDDAAAKLSWGDAARIKYINKERWFAYQIAKQIHSELEEMLEPSEKARVTGMVITADPNNGKSVLVRKFAARHPATEREDGTGVDVPVLLIDAPAKADIGWLLNEVLVALNAPYKDKEKDESKFRQILGLFKRLNIRMLIIDEITDVISGTATKQREFLTIIKQTSTRAKIPIVLTGTPPIISALSIDDQIKSRFISRPLPDWQKDAQFLSLLGAFEKQSPLKLPSELTNEKNRMIAAKILEKSKGRIGWIIEILQKAAKKAILTGEERISEKVIDFVGID